MTKLPLTAAQEDLLTSAIEDEFEVSRSDAQGIVEAMSDEEILARFNALNS